MIEVTLDYQGIRRPCVACGGCIDKFVFCGRFGHNSLCRDCMFANDLPARLLDHAAYVREAADREAARIEALADETFDMPTEATLTKAEADMDAYWVAEDARAAALTQREKETVRVRLVDLDMEVTPDGMCARCGQEAHPFLYCEDEDKELDERQADLEAAGR